MAFDYFTLQALAGQLRQTIGGKQIVAAWIGDDRELAFACDREGYLQVWPGAGGGLCFQSGEWPAGLERSEALERYLVNAWVDGIWLEEGDRIVRFRLKRRNRQGEASFGQLIVELIPPHCAAVLIRQRNGEILEKWGRESKSTRQRLIVGHGYRPPECSSRLLPGRDAEQHFRERMRAAEGTVEAAGARLLVGMDRCCFSEILHRAGVDQTLPVAAVDLEALERIWRIADTLYRQPPETWAFVWEEKAQWRFSALEPTRLGAGVNQVATVSQAIRTARITPVRQDEALTRRKRIQERLKTALKGLRRKVEAIGRELAEADQAEVMEKKGNVLIAQLHQVQSGASWVELGDIYDIDGRARIGIELDPRRTPAENASQYLKRAQKLYRRRRILPQRLAHIQTQLTVLESFGENLERVGEESLQEIEQGLMEQGMTAENSKDRPRQKVAQAHPRRYRTSAGWEVWAGRNNRENDLLTHRLAAQNDYWFHAHGYSGSHVVLRREGRREEPSAQTIKEAAALAAYWSKGKTARWAPVIYTQVKYVSKPRGGAPGQAVVRREKTIMVEPGLLAEADESGVL